MTLYYRPGTNGHRVHRLVTGHSANESGNLPVNIIIMLHFSCSVLSIGYTMIYDIAPHGESDDVDCGFDILIRDLQNQNTKYVYNTIP